MNGCPAVYHSRDLKHWELLTHILNDERVDLKKLPSAKGLWAPCLTWCAADGLFYLVYGVMNSMNARYFDVDNFVVTAPEIEGPWSEPVYLHSVGFDASILHYEDGKKYIVALEWETRDGYDKPGGICVAEYDPVDKAVLSTPRRIWNGATDRGCLEAPHLTRRNDWYYLMCAEGGTGYNHCVTMARAKNVFGPYEADPNGPILTSNPGDFSERTDTDHLKPRHYNPAALMQKAGHGSYVNLSDDVAYMVYLCARPFVPELRCTLGRETAIARMRWTDDGWLRTEDEDVLPKLEVPEPKLPECLLPVTASLDDFVGPALQNFYYAPRIMPQKFTDLTARPGWARLRGQESLPSLNKVSLLARKLTSVNTCVTTKMEFSPTLPQHEAGLVFYYDNMDYFSLAKHWSESMGCEVLRVTVLENGVRTQYVRVPVESGVPVYLRLDIQGKENCFAWSYDGRAWQSIGPVCDTSKLSDEYCSFGEFTGAMVGIYCVDRMFRRHYADFDFFGYLIG